MAIIKSKALIGMAVALVLPLSFFIIAKVAKKDRLIMPSYYAEGEALPAHEGLKRAREGALKPIGNLVAIDQFGERVSLNDDLKGKMLAVNFFFTSCTSTCPKLSAHMRMLEYAFRRTPMRQNDTTVQFISISVDPANDSPAALHAYARRVGADENHWWFLTGDKKVIYDWARAELHLSVPAGDGGADDWVHSNNIIVLDRDHFIRGYYNGLDTAELRRCAYDIGLLAMEKK